MSDVTFKILRSGVAGRAPTTLDSGELAINFKDGKLYYSDDSNNITFFGDSDHVAQKLETRLSTFQSGLDSAAVLDLVPFTTGYTDNTITATTLRGYDVIDGPLLSQSDFDAFGILQVDKYDNMEPTGRIEHVDFGSV